MSGTARSGRRKLEPPKEQAGYPDLPAADAAGNDDALERALISALIMVSEGVRTGAIDPRYGDTQVAALKAACAQLERRRKRGGRLAELRALRAEIEAAADTDDLEAGGGDAEGTRDGARG